MALNFLAIIVTIIVLLIPGLVLSASNDSVPQIDLVSAISLAVIAASITTILFYRIKLPALLAYIVSGVLIGGFAGQFIGHSLALIQEISHVGLVFLLFIIGMEMDLVGIKRLGPRVAIAMILQAPVAFAVIYALQWATYSLTGINASSGAWFFYAVAGSLGSTAVVVKLLGDKFDLGSRAGKITVMTLIIEDIWAISALSYVQSQSHQGGSSLTLMLAGGVALTIVIVLLSRFVLSKVMTLMARSPDLLTLMALGWCFLCASGFSQIGLSAEMGALIAGLTIRRLPEHMEVQSKVASLRDFFMALFFVALGISLPTPTLSVLLQAAMLTLVVIFARLLLFAPLLLAARQRAIVAFAASINLAQISEFVLLLIPLGIAQGLLNPEDQMVISYALMLSVVIAAFAINNNYPLAIAIERLFDREAKSDTIDEHPADKPAQHSGKDIIMLGYFVNTEAIARYIEKNNPELCSRILVIDFNIEKHHNIEKHGLEVAYGDISNPHALRELGICDAQVVVSTIPDAFLHGIRNDKLIEAIRHLNPACKIITTSLSAEGKEYLLTRGAFACISTPDESAPAFTTAIIDALRKYTEQANA